MKLPVVVVLCACCTFPLGLRAEDSAGAKAMMTIQEIDAAFECSHYAMDKYGKDKKDIGEHLRLFTYGYKLSKEFWSKPENNYFKNPPEKPSIDSANKAAFEEFVNLMGGEDFPVYMTAKAESKAEELVENNIKERAHKESETGWTYDMSRQERELIKDALYRERNCALIGRVSK
ncbi:hypothetical protein [Azotobacter chroococcum]|uniref:DUF1311 domain-containing protein n=1 Tax=Azotobacter chroococcum TaxID=353 RepID=A0AAP9YH06_9GAMM|nr:hypothetical protein [Azotobacter chroococcum]QQE91145.1 hypothetical protein GKQ51_21885 [Azotobacter chroococcum]TKD44823.1 hypothetical protein FCG41_05390 [Azotobacter chroococcum]